jgi:putative transposase
MIDVFAFVLMPNHIHLIWRTNKMNGKETAQGSFLKYVAQMMQQKLNNILLNRLAIHWNLAGNPCKYYYSSASFYEMNERHFDF